MGKIIYFGSGEEKDSSGKIILAPGIEAIFQRGNEDGELWAAIYHKDKLLKDSSGKSISGWWRTTCLRQLEKTILALHGAEIEKAKGV